MEIDTDLSDSSPVIGMNVDNGIKCNGRNGSSISSSSVSTPSDTNVISYDFIVKGDEEDDQVLFQTTMDAASSSDADVNVSIIIIIIIINTIIIIIIIIISKDGNGYGSFRFICCCWHEC